MLLAIALTQRIIALNLKIQKNEIYMGGAGAF